jgi:hypothetical protein
MADDLYSFMNRIKKTSQVTKQLQQKQARQIQQVNESNEDDEDEIGEPIHQSSFKPKVRVVKRAITENRKPAVKPMPKKKNEYDADLVPFFDRIAEFVKYEGLRVLDQLNDWMDNYAGAAPGTSIDESYVGVSQMTGRPVRLSALEMESRRASGQLPQNVTGYKTQPTTPAMSNTAKSLFEQAASEDKRKAAAGVGTGDYAGGAFAAPPGVMEANLINAEAMVPVNPEAMHNKPVVKPPPLVTPLAPIPGIHDKEGF